MRIIKQERKYGQLVVGSCYKYYNKILNNTNLFDKFARLRSKMIKTVESKQDLGENSK